MVDFELMRYMGWSWADLQATPEYVQRYCWDLMQIRLQAEADAHDKAMSDAKKDGGGHGT